MPLPGNLTLSDKLNILSEKLERVDSLISETEGSKAVVLIVSPKEETTAVRELNIRYEGRLKLLNLGSVLAEVVGNYGLDNLAEDFAIFDESCIRDFSQLLLEKLKERIIEASEEKHLTVIHRLGILNGFFGINPLIEGVTGKLVNPVLFIYPGKKRENDLTFLDGRHTTSLYRALVI